MGRGYGQSAYVQCSTNPVLLVMLTGQHGQRASFASFAPFRPPMLSYFCTRHELSTTWCRENIIECVTTHLPDELPSRFIVTPTSFFIPQLPAVLQTQPDNIPLDRILGTVPDS